MAKKCHAFLTSFILWPEGWTVRTSLPLDKSALLCAFKKRPLPLRFQQIFAENLLNKNEQKKPILWPYPPTIGALGRQSLPVTAINWPFRRRRKVTKMAKSLIFGLCSVEFPTGKFHLKIEAVKAQNRTFVRFLALNLNKLTIVKMSILTTWFWCFLKTLTRKPGYRNWNKTVYTKTVKKEGQSPGGLEFHHFFKNGIKIFYCAKRILAQYLGKEMHPFLRHFWKSTRVCSFGPPKNTPNLS